MSYKSENTKGGGNACLCGCGQKTYLYRGVSRRFVKGHNIHLTHGRLANWVKTNGSPMKGKKHSVASKKLMGDKIKGMFSGEKHYNWKGGITSPDKRKRASFRWYLQKRVFERDVYVCQICGNRGGCLQVDHIRPWKDYPELRFDIDNCRTLCAKCHYKITFGKDMPDEIRLWGQNFKHIERMVI